MSGWKSRRHPAQVTADRLGDHYEAYFSLLSPRERDALGQLKWALEQIADGERTRTEMDG